jgi:ribA/ribD-fused uncharacterized protein
MEAIRGFNGKYRFLSNFYVCPILFDGIVWPSVEHGYQAYKSEDRALRELVSRMPHPQEAKYFGREVQQNGTIRPHFHSMKTWIMHTFVQAKFFQNRELAEKLMETGAALLVESNTWHDQFWGDCTCTKNPECAKREGVNALGRILMDVRAQLRAANNRDATT